MKSIRGGEFAPPSGTPDAELRPWAIDRGLDPDHPLFQKFLDVRRQYPRRIPDWPSAWRIFLGDEHGKFAARGGVRNAPAPLPPDPETAVRERQRVKARDEDYERAKANKAPMPAALLAAVGGKPRP